MCVGTPPAGTTAADAPQGPAAALSLHGLWCSTLLARLAKLPHGSARIAALCGVHILMSTSGAIVMDWLKQRNGGMLPFSVPALTFHAFGISALIGLLWAMSKGRVGLQMMMRPDMIWRFGIMAVLFTVGDMLSFMSMQHLDAGTFSLLGK